MTSADLDFGFSLVKVEHPSIPISPLALFSSDSSHQSLYFGGFYSLGIYRRIAYIFPQRSAGIFVKPGFGTNIHKHSFNHYNMLVLQLPVCVATELGKTEPHKPGIIAGEGVSFNYYEFTGYRIPPFYLTVPYFFVQLHWGIFGLRFADIPNQTYMNSDGTITRTRADFTITILGTAPIEKKQNSR